MLGGLRRSFARARVRCVTVGYDNTCTHMHIIYSRLYTDDRKGSLKPSARATHIAMLTVQHTPNVICGSIRRTSSARTYVQPCATATGSILGLTNEMRAPFRHYRHCVRAEHILLERCSPSVIVLPTLFRV